MQSSAFSMRCIRAASVSGSHVNGCGTWKRTQPRRTTCRVIPDMPAPPPNAVHTPVHVVETSLGIVDDIRLLRHLGLRFGEDDSYSEAHFGPSDAGSFHEGFLKTGEGKVAQSEYLEVFPAGETKLTKEEALEWCRNWAKDKVFVTVGQNCWSMVHEFLTTHEGCEITEEIQFKEQSVNGASQMLINMIEKVAEEEDRTSEAIMQDLMEKPRSTLKQIFTAERLANMVDMPDSVSDAVETGKEKMNKVTESQMGMSTDEISDKVGNTQTMKNVKKMQQEVASLFASRDEQ